MKLKITLKIECGEKTCASKPGIFCHFLRFGLKGDATCSLFGNVFDKDGWIKRHPSCLKLAKKV